MKENNFEVVVTIVNRGFSDYVIESARESGASGATIINARGTGVHENNTILGIKIQPEKEIVLIIAESTKKKKIMTNICKNANLNKEGNGLCFSMPVTDLKGVTHLNKNNIKKTEKNKTNNKKDKQK